MRMYGIPYGIICSLINIIHHAGLAKSTVISHVDAVTGSLHPLYEEMLGRLDILLRACLWRRDELEDSRDTVLAVGAGR